MPQDFASFGFTPNLTEAIAACGYQVPTPVQDATWADLCAGHDVLACAQTGSGKTGAFLFPIIQQLGVSPRRAVPPLALVLVPTRELASQVFWAFQRYAKGSNLRSMLAVGGDDKSEQELEAARGIDVLVATPGRLEELVLERKVDVSEVRFIVLDEADRLLQLGFYNASRKLIRACHHEAQISLFSATLDADVQAMAKDFLRSAVTIEADPPGRVVTSLSSYAVRIKPSAKPYFLRHWMALTQPRKVLAFVRTRARVRNLAAFLRSDERKVFEVHGAMVHEQRAKAVGEFREEKGPCVLVATDLASRGLDIPDVDWVVNVELSDEVIDYVHRVGRTARQARAGSALSLISDEEVPKLGEILKMIGSRVEDLVVGDFDLNARYEAIPEVVPVKKKVATRRTTKLPGKARMESAERRKRREAKQRSGDMSKVKQISKVKVQPSRGRKQGRSGNR